MFKARLIAAILGVFSTASVSAALVTFEYTGVVTASGGIFLPEAPIGSRLDGTFAFDDGLTDSDLSPDVDEFRSETPAANQALASSFAATINAGTLSLSESVDGDPAFFHARVAIVDVSARDAFRYEIERQVTSDDRFTIFLDDNDGTPDAIATGSGNLTNDIADLILHLETIDISAFQGNFASWATSDPSGVVAGFVDFRINSITRQAQDPTPQVPSPAPLGLVALGMFGLGFASLRRRRHAK